MSDVSAGERHCDGGRNPTVHAGGSPIPTVKSPLAIPVGLFIGPMDWIEATNGGSSTSSCSIDA